MSTAALPDARNQALDDFHERLLAPDLVPARPARSAHPAAVVRRRGTLEQGRALESLGHAVEYLMDSGIFYRDKTDHENNEAALQILMRLSRSVFEDCPEILPLRHRIKRWGHHLVARALRLQPEPATPPC